MPQSFGVKWEILMTSQVESFLDDLYESGSKYGILFCFDPWRSAILLIAGDKSGQWTRWYRE